MVSRVAFAFFVGHHKLLFIALGVGRSNDNANASLKNLVTKMLSRVVLKRCIVFEFFRPFLTRSRGP